MDRLTRGEGGTTKSLQKLSALLALACLASVGCKINEQVTKPEDASESGTARLELVRQRMEDDLVEVEWKLTGDRKWVWGSADPDLKLRYAYPLGTGQTHGGKHIWTITLRLRRFPGTDKVVEERVMLGDLPEAKSGDNFLDTYDRPIEFGKEYTWKGSLKDSVKLYQTEPTTMTVPGELPLYEFKQLDEEGKERIQGIRLKVME